MKEGKELAKVRIVKKGTGVIKERGKPAEDEEEAEEEEAGDEEDGEEAEEGVEAVSTASVKAKGKNK